MSEIVSLLTVLSPHLSVATLCQFCQIAFAMLAMTGGVTMRNISRWTTQGGSYRTIQTMGKRKQTRTMFLSLLVNMIFHGTGKGMLRRRF